MHPQKPSPTASSAMAKASEHLHWHHQKPLTHPLTICFLYPQLPFPGYPGPYWTMWLSLTWGGSFWARKTSSPLSMAGQLPC